MSDAGGTEPRRRRSTEPPATVGPAVSPQGAEPAVPGRPDHIGSYKILGKLGEGGMGVVFEAEQQNPRRRVALKVVRGDRLLDDAHVRMLEREAEALGRLKHPNIAAIYESGRTPGGWHFFAMELVLGETLHAYLASEPRPDSSGALRRRLEMFRQICSAVAYAHQRGVIHRDLKPSNIIVSPSGVDSAGWPEIKILDFGLARLSDPQGHASVATEIGVIKGTLPYMSPEQVRGDPQLVDVRSDVYSLGVILYEMLTGEHPFDLHDRSMIETARAICEEPPRPLRRTWRSSVRLDADIATIVTKALCKDPDERYAGAAALAEDIGRYLEAQPILARPPSLLYQLRKFAQRHRATVWAASILLLAVVCGAIAAAAFAVREARRSAELRRFAYRSVIQSATEAVERGERQLARKLLLSEQVPAELRGFEWRVLWARSEPPGVQVDAPVTSESSPRVSLDGDELVYLIDDTGYRFDAATGERRGSWPLGEHATAGFPSSPQRIEHGPDGSFAAITDVAGDHRLRLFRPSGELCGAVDDVSTCQFGPAGSGIVRIGRPKANHILLWDLATCRERLVLGWDWWRSRAVSADGTLVSVFKGEPSVSWGMSDVHDTRTGDLRARLMVASESSVEEFTPDGTRLLSGSHEGDLRILRLGPPPTEEPPISAHEGRILALAVAGDGRFAATAGEEGTVRLWDLGTRERLSQYQVRGRARSLQFGGGDRFLLCTAVDGSVTILDASEREDPRRLAGHRSYIYSVALRPDGEVIATGDWVGVVMLWDARSGRQIARLADVEGGIHELRFTEDGSRLIGVGDAIHVWELRTGKLLGALERASADRPRFSDLPAAGTPLDAEGRRLVLAWDAPAGQVVVWDRETGDVSRQPLAALDLAADWISSDHRLAVAAVHEPASSPAFEVRELEGALRLRLSQNGGASWPFALTHGRERARIAAPLAEPGSETVEAGATIGLWDLAAGRKLGELRGHTREVLTLAFTPDDSRLVTGSRDGTVRVWDPRTLEEIARFSGHRLYILDLAFSRDGTRLVTTSGDATARIWDAVSTNERLRARRQQDQDLVVARPILAAMLEQEGDVERAVARLEQAADLADGVRQEALREALRIAIASREGDAGGGREQEFFLPPRSRS